MLKQISIFAALLICAITTNAQHSKGLLSIGFIHYIDEEQLVLDEKTYKNTLGQNFSVTKFKYYISNIRLKNVNGKEIDLPGYFLVDEETPASKKISLKNIPEGEYISLSYIVGVDSTHNCSGAQSGALDPVNAMFWTWNTGYIFLKLEGKAETSGSPGKIFEYHVGGYKSPFNNIRNISLELKNHLLIGKGKQSELNICVNVAEILKTPNSIDFSKLSSAVDAPKVGKLADNYCDMFSIGK